MWPHAVSRYSCRHTSLLFKLATVFVSSVLYRSVVHLHCCAFALLMVNFFATLITEVHAAIAQALLHEAFAVVFQPVHSGDGRSAACLISMLAMLILTRRVPCCRERPLPPPC